MIDDFETACTRFLASDRFASLSARMDVDEKCREDVREHVRYFHRALFEDDPGILARYLTWCDFVYACLELDGADLQQLLESVRDFFQEEYGASVELSGRYSFESSGLDAAHLIDFHFGLFEGDDAGCLPGAREKCQRDARLILDGLHDAQVNFTHLVKWQGQMLDILHIEPRSLICLLGSLGAYAAQVDPEIIPRIREAFRVHAGVDDDPLSSGLVGSMVDHAQPLAQEIFDFHSSVFITPPEHRNPEAQARCLEDIAYHVSYLGQSSIANSRELFLDYVQWGVTVLEGLSIPKHSLICCLVSIRAVLQRHPALVEFDFAHSVLGEAVMLLLTNNPERESFIVEGAPLAADASRYLELLLEGDRRRAIRFIMDLHERGESIRDIYLHVFQVSQYETGRLWQLNRISVADEHFCTATTQLAMSQLYPYMISSDDQQGCFVAACVGNELHEIGVRMVADFMEMEGWETYYLGANTPVEAIIAACQERGARILGLSATITMQVRRIKEVIAAVRRVDALQNLRIMVGGYPFLVDPGLYQEVGADAYAQSAEDVSVVARKLLAA